MTIDWNKVIKETDEGTKVIPEGEYNVRVVQAQATKASTGAEMIKTTVRVEDDAYAGRSVVTNLVFTFDNPQAMRMLFRRLSALGVTSEWLAETNASVADIAREINGRSCVAKLNVRKWNGEDRNDVEMFLDGLGGGAGIPGGVPRPTGPDAAVPPPPTLEGFPAPGEKQEEPF